MHKPLKRQFDWKGRFETLEDRRVMSADPLSGFLGEGIVHHTFDESIVHHEFVEQSTPIEHQLVSGPDFWVDPTNPETISDQLGEIEQTLSSAHNTTGLNQVLANYGFNGKGQTVAIIDSGIAYNHFALGGGLGANYRVVGGYDFTENDANPYDDGPYGSHGTHVAGIVGGDAGSDRGVASSVDLVALRVFDDSGAGYMSWVESALQWVHQHRNDFENPITAINLSLGIPGYNSSVPLITSLDDEFAQLKADGIFIAVSAGNDFATYNAPGLGNPASSPNVVPVMSVTDSGNLAGYSQRDVRAIAAPGSSIRSTVPDYKGNKNGIDDDYANFSGTSMASPYIAGASVLIRQAMEFVGYTGITQDSIYDHMRATATEFLDAATNLTFKRINLEAAINALMPSDDYGSTLATAFNLGTLTSTVSQSGVIGTLNDVDYFKFSASSNGTVTFAANNMTHELGAAWSVAESTGTVSGNQGQTFSFDVIAGQTYTVGFSSSGGLGYYSLDVTQESSFTYTDWGSVSYAQLNGLSVAGESWYRVQASQAGYLTVEGAFAAQGGQVNLQLYNANMQMVSSGNAVNGTSRVDAYASAGEEFFVLVQGTNSAVDYRLSNLVSVTGTTVNVTGTAGDDTFAFTAGSTHQVTVNGVTHEFAAIAVTNIEFNGGAGADSIVMTGTSGVETATLRVGNSILEGTGFTATAVGIENVVANSGGGADVANLYDSAGDDTFVAQPEYGRLTGNGFFMQVNNFAKVYANSVAGGYDLAYLYDSTGNDLYVSRPEYGLLSGSTFYNRANGFDKAFAYANSGGQDRGYFYDSPGDDTFTAYPDYALMTGNGFYNYANGIELVYAYASLGGYDVSNLYDSAGNDTFVARPEYGRMSGAGFYNYGKGFDAVYAFAVNGGYDRSNLYDSAGDDVFVGRPEYGQLSGTGFYNIATGFDRVYAYTNEGGTDRSYLYDSSGTDQFVGTPDYGRMSGAGYYNYGKDFEMVYAYSQGNGNDQAILRGRTGDNLAATDSYWRLYGTDYYNYANGFVNYEAYDEYGNPFVTSNAIDSYFDDLGA